MSDLIQTLHDFASLFDGLKVPYAIMGGWAVRMYGLPRPTSISRSPSGVSGCPNCMTRPRRGFTVPEQFTAGWVDTVAGMPLVKFRLYLHDRGIDDEAYMRRWAAELGVAEKLQEVLAERT